MTKYRILEVGDHYEIDQQVFWFYWARALNLCDFPMKFETVLEAKARIGAWCKKDNVRVVEEINCES